VSVCFVTLCRPTGGLLKFQRKMPSLSAVQYVLMGQFIWRHISGDSQRHDSLNCDVILAPCLLLQTAVSNFIGTRRLLRRLKKNGKIRLLIYTFECSELCDITYCTSELCDITYCTSELCDIAYCTSELCDITYCTSELCDITYCTSELCDITYCTIELCDITYCTILNKYLEMHLKKSTCYSCVIKLIFLVNS
jgi:hypothetical protein